MPATEVRGSSKDTCNADLTIKATGYQWKWGYDYRGRARHFLPVHARLVAARVSGRRHPGPATTC